MKQTFAPFMCCGCARNCHLPIHPVWMDLHGWWSSALYCVLHLNVYEYKKASSGKDRHVTCSSVGGGPKIYRPFQLAASIRTFSQVYSLLFKGAPFLVLHTVYIFPPIDLYWKVTSDFPIRFYSPQWCSNGLHHNPLRTHKKKKEDGMQCFCTQEQCCAVTP